MLVYSVGVEMLLEINRLSEVVQDSIELIEYSLSNLLSIDRLASYHLKSSLEQFLQKYNL
jgi:hypothetical protein